jgi:hypothetical protein
MRKAFNVANTNKNFGLHRYRLEPTLLNPKICMNGLTFLMPRTRKALLDRQAYIKWVGKGRRIEPGETVFVFIRVNGTPIKRCDKAWRKALKLVGARRFELPTP